jgi:predicted porin
MNLNRKAMVLAVGAALAAPCAYAQVTSPAGSNWEFYGKFYPEMTHAHGDGATAPGTTGLATFVGALGAVGTTGANAPNATIPRWEMQISNSYLGFRGSRDIGGGSKAIWQLEQTVNIDEGNQTASFASRDSFAGVSNNGWGTIRLGNMDTPFKRYGNIVGFLGVNSGNIVTPSNVKDKAGFGTSSSSSFNLRRANAIDFTSPTTLGGLQGAVQYSIGNPTETGIILSPKRFPRVVSWAVKWEQGPWYAGFMQEAHFDLFGGSLNAPGGSAGTGLSNFTDPSVNSKDTANQVVVVYKMGIHSFEADFTRKKYGEYNVTPTAGGKFQEYKNISYMLLMENRWSGAWRTAFSYVKAGAGSCKQAILLTADCSTAGLEGAQISAGVAYYLDPSAYLFGLLARVTNGSSAQYNNTALQKPNPGEDVKNIAVGFAYTF